MCACSQITNHCHSISPALFSAENLMIYEPKSSAIASLDCRKKNCRVKNNLPEAFFDQLSFHKENFWILFPFNRVSLQQGFRKVNVLEGITNHNLTCVFVGRNPRCLFYWRDVAILNESHTHKLKCHEFIQLCSISTMSRGSIKNFRTISASWVFVCEILFGQQ